MFHIGHLRLLQQLKTMGDELIVAISTDAFNEIKNKKAMIPYEQRAEIVKSIRYVDRVIPEESWEQKVDDVKRYNVDIFAIGDDWAGKFDELKAYCEVIYLPRTVGISTTKLKQSLGRLLSVSKNDIMTAFEILGRLRDDLS